MKTCSVEGCDKEYYAKGLCQNHYNEVRYKGLGVCFIVDCDKPVKNKGLCGKHYQRWRKKGSPTARTTTDLNEYIDCENYSEMYLYDKDSNHIATAKIDSEDVEKCKQYKWHLANGYIESGEGESRIWLHKFVMRVDSSIMVDHIHDRYTYDNRKSQLRVCNHAQNAQNRKLSSNNTSGAKGVFWYDRYGKWQVKVVAFNKTHFFGNYDDYDQACQVARTERKRLHGEFAREM